MADPLRRGPVGSDEAIQHELWEIGQRMCRGAAVLHPGDPCAGVDFATDLEGDINRLYDICEALNARYLAACRAVRPDPFSDDAGEPPK